MGLGRKLFTRERLTAADVNGYLMDQTVMTFASAAERDTAIPNPSPGMVCYLDSTKRFYWWDEVGSTWWYLGGSTPATATIAVTGFTAVGGRAPAYTLDSDGYVNIEGAMTNNGAYTPPSATFATLPVGVRPAKLSNFAAATNANNNGVYNLEITTGGAMIVRGPSLAAAAGLVWGLDGVRFRPA